MDPSGSGAVVLLDRRVVRVHKNGLSRTFAQRVVQVLTERGAEENKEFAVHYMPGWTRYEPTEKGHLVEHNITVKPGEPLTGEHFPTVMENGKMLKPEEGK